MSTEKISAGGKRDRRIFIVILSLSFVSIFIFNYLTPYITDDFGYGSQVEKASSVWDLIKLTANEYMTWNGRSIAQFFVRLSLYLPRIFFKIANSLVFVWISLLIYKNINGRKKYDAVVYLMIIIALWFQAVEFAETILWQTGAPAYLWTTTFILTFLSLVRSCWAKYGPSITKAGQCPVYVCILLTVTGFIAGWGNYNTSGGAVLFVLIMMIVSFKRIRKIQGFLWAAFAGSAAGLIVMVAAPGNYGRASYSDEPHSGLYGIASRFQKITLSVEDNFLILLSVLAVTIVISILHGRKRGLDQKQIFYSMRWRLMWTFIAFATSYALIATAPPQNRAYFGAGIFLIIAVIQGIVDNIKEEQTIYAQEPEKRPVWLRTVYGSAVAIFVMRLFFVYMDNGTNLIRIYRDSNERINYILDEKAAGVTDITVAKLHSDFKTVYSEAYDGDLTEDPGYWTNSMMAGYYGVNSITAIDYDDWALETGRETQEQYDSSKAIHAAQAEAEK